MTQDIFKLNCHLSQTLTSALGCRTWRLMSGVSPASYLHHQPLFLRKQYWVLNMTFTASRTSNMMLSDFHLPEIKTAPLWMMMQKFQTDVYSSSGKPLYTEAGKEWWSDLNHPHILCNKEVLAQVLTLLQTLFSLLLLHIRLLSFLLSWNN